MKQYFGNNQPSEKSRLLVIAPNWIGDAIMAQPLLRLLRAQHPNAQIDVLAPKWVAPVVQAMSEVDMVLESTIRHGSIKIRDYWKHAQEIRRKEYSAVYVLPNSIKYALLPWLAGIKKRIGYRGETRYGLINVMHHDSKISPRPMTDFYAALARAPQDPIPATLPKPRLSVSTLKNEQLFGKFGLATNLPIIVLAPGAEFGSAKRWPETYFADLARKILGFNRKAQIVILGGPNDRAVCQQIHEQVPNALNLAGNTTLEQAIGLISGASAIISNDSGLLHIASALNRPTLAIYGPTDPQHAPSHSDKKISISLNLSCAPCKQKECPLGHRECMTKISPDMVWQSLLPILLDTI
ncbi:lipopolysaccharide heptosyltransferase II [Undibacterium sp. Di24W]|uniref:lipopolysaccharide heptosyltransferase II n=1 Tax=Undibacterium sp. Di24W TaxID=3413033 RepID=UPI003BEFA513